MCGVTCGSAHLKLGPGTMRPKLNDFSVAGRSLDDSFASPALPNFFIAELFFIFLRFQCSVTVVRAVALVVSVSCIFNTIENGLPTGRCFLPTRQISSDRVQRNDLGQSLSAATAAAA